MKKLLSLILISTSSMLFAQNPCTHRGPSFVKQPSNSNTVRFIRFFTNPVQEGVSYENWDFGDGQTRAVSKSTTSGLSERIEHSYASSGDYLVCREIILTDKNQDTICTASFCDSIHVGYIKNNGCDVTVTIADTLEYHDFYVQGTQVAYTPNEPHNYTIWVGEDTLSYSVASGTGSFSWGTVYYHQKKYKACAFHYYKSNNTNKIISEDIDCKDVWLISKIQTSATVSHNHNASTPGLVNHTAVVSNSGLDPNIHSEGFLWKFDTKEGFAHGLGPNASHQYRRTGKHVTEFHYRIEETNPNSSNPRFPGYALVYDTVEVQPSNTCTADFTWRGLFQGNRAEFINQSVNLYGPGYTSTYHWDFGNGNVSDFEHPEHTFGNQVTRHVTLIHTVTNNATQQVVCADTVTKIVVSSSNPSQFCEAKYVVDTANSGNGNILIYNHSAPASTSSIISQVSYQWDFGDGNTSNSPYPSHTYAQSGTYNLCVTVTAVDTANVTCTDTYCSIVGIDSLGNLISSQTNAGFTINVVDSRQMTTDENVAQKQPLLVFPNPASEILNVVLPEKGFENVEWTIIDTGGRAVARGNAQESNFSIDINHLPSGFYFLQVAGEQVYHQKITINR